MQKTIETTKPNPILRYYSCGEVDQKLSTIYKGFGDQVRTFPAGVFLYENAAGEKVLFDTGYSTSIYTSGIAASIYSKILKPRIKEKDEIHNQLRNNGVDPNSIGRVVLSHLHPDHVGGVQFFPNAEFVLSREAFEAFKKPRIMKGTLQHLLPEWFHEATKLVVDEEHFASTSNGLIDGYDLLGDESLILTKLPGHAPGHIGALILNKLMLAADASWGRDLLRSSDHTRFAARVAINDLGAYRKTASRLKELEAQGIEVYFSHDTYEQSVLI